MAELPRHGDTAWEQPQLEARGSPGGKGRVFQNKGESGCRETPSQTLQPQVGAPASWWSGTERAGESEPHSLSPQVSYRPPWLNPEGSRGQQAQQRFSPFHCPHPTPEDLQYLSLFYDLKCEAALLCCGLVGTLFSHLVSGNTHSFQFFPPTCCQPQA